MSQSHSHSRYQQRGVALKGYIVGEDESPMIRSAGLLVPVEDAPALASAMMKLAASPQLRARYGQTARELVVDKLSAKIIGSSIVRLYNDLAPAE